MSPFEPTSTANRPPVGELVVVGGGGHARAVIDAAWSSGRWQVVGYADVDDCPMTDALFGLPYLGDDAAVISAGEDHPERWYILGAGNVGPADLRRDIVARYGAGANWATVVHAGAVVSSRARLGAGTVVMAGAVVNAGTVIGEHAIINSGAVVEHDCRIGAYCHVGPGAVVGGGADVAEGAFLGLGSRIRDHVEIGPDAQVGMGAVVVGPVPAGARVRGVPARAWRGDR